MQKFHIKDAKGLFFQPTARGIASLAVVEHLRSVYAPGIEDSVEREKVLKALAALSALPVVEATMDRCELDPPGARREVRKARGWLAPNSAQSASQDPVECGSPEEAGWSAMAEAVKQRHRIEWILAQVQAPPTRDFQWSGATTIHKKIGQAIFVPIDQAEANAESESFVLHVFGRGFLDAKGCAGPLARARLFESAQAALRTVRSSAPSSWKVVRVDVGLAACVDLPGDSACDDLQASIALQEAKALDQALETAGVERLRAKIAQIEAAHGATDAAPKKAARL
jgi:hypothetical protein